MPQRSPDRLYSGDIIPVRPQNAVGTAKLIQLITRKETNVAKYRVQSHCPRAFTHNKPVSPFPLEVIHIETEDAAIAFQTVAEVVVAGVAGGTAEADAIALEPGPQGNVDSGTVTLLPEALAELVEARNPEPMAGGDVRAEAAVSEADLARVRSQALQFLQAVAQSEMEAQITEREFLARESLRAAKERGGGRMYYHTCGDVLSVRE